MGCESSGGGVNGVEGLVGYCDVVFDVIWDVMCDVVCDVVCDGMYGVEGLGKGSFQKEKPLNIWNFPYIGWPPPNIWKKTLYIFGLKMLFSHFYDFFIFPLVRPKILKQA